MSKQLRVISDGIDRTVETAVKAVTLAIHAQVVEATPVDTGWARANWVPRITSAVGSLSTPATREGREAAVASAGTAQAAALASIALTYNLQQGAVYISNNVPYISKLNAGSSTQAPSNFVQIAINLALRKVSV